MLITLVLLPKGGRNLLSSLAASSSERYVYESHLPEKSRLAMVTAEAPVGSGMNNP